MRFKFTSAGTHRTPFARSKRITIGVAVATLFLLSGCGEKRTRVVSSSSSLSTGGCEVLPDSATVTDAAATTTSGASACPTAAGAWTRFDVVIDSTGTAIAVRTCNAREDDHPGSQEDFDASTVDASEVGVSRYSNHDFRVSTICASGSFLNEEAGDETRRVRIWEKR